MTIAKFSSEIKNRHIAKSCRFAVHIPFPTFMVGKKDIPISSIFDDSSLMQIFAESVHFPGFDIMTNQVKDDGIGREVPYDKMYPPITCTFICDADMTIKKFFDEWVQGIMKTETGTFRYSDQYIVDAIEIIQKNEADEDTYVVTLYDVYPKLVNDIGLSSSSREFNRCTVQFVYSKWQSIRVK